MIKAFIDRIEGEFAVLVLAGDPPVQFDLPLRALPEGLGAGDHLLLRIDPDPEAATATLRRVEELQRELTEGSDSDRLHHQL